MASVEVSGFRRRNGALWLAIVLLMGLMAALLLMSVPAARADGPTITLSTSTTNPGGEVFIKGTGWSPAKHYSLYVYSQRLCNGQPTCPVPSPASKYLIGSGNVPIRGDGTFTFDFNFSSRASTITYVFTVIADYPTDTPYTASVPEQVVPAGTPPSGTPISSNPSPSPTAGATNTPVVTATSGANQGGNGGNGNQDNAQQSGSSSKALIAVVGVLLFIMVVILIILLVILPPKRRAIRAAYYGTQASGSRSYAAPGVQSRRTTGGYQPPIEPEQPWQGGVAQWDDPPRGSGPAARDRYSSRPPPRRPSDREY